MEKNSVLKFKPNYIGTAFKESQEIAKKEKYTIQKLGLGGYPPIASRQSDFEQSICAHDIKS